MARNFEGLLEQLDNLERDILNLKRPEERPKDIDEVWSYARFLVTLAGRRGASLDDAAKLVVASLGKKYTCYTHFTTERDFFALTLDPDGGMHQMSFIYNYPAKSTPTA